MSQPALHPGIAGLEFLLGTWVGEGSGDYPTVQPFSYREEINFSPSGKPFIFYAQRTWGTEDGRLLHVETGYLRAGEGGHVELVAAQPTGIVEVEEGTVQGWRLELSSRFVGLTTTAKDVSTLARSITVEGDVMTYELVMGAVGQPPQRHVGARLSRLA
jgi:hypothetical protein